MRRYCGHAQVRNLTNCAIFFLLVVLHCVLANNLKGSIHPPQVRTGLVVEE
jgi:hypothetical protein